MFTAWLLCPGCSLERRLGGSQSGLDVVLTRDISARSLTPIDPKWARNLIAMVTNLHRLT